MGLLTEDNFLLYAAKNYDNPQCVSVEEFNSDLKRINYIKKLCTKYKEGRGNYTHLLLNHVMSLYNLFGPIATTRMLYLKAGHHFDVLKPILVHLGIMPECIVDIKKFNVEIKSSDIMMDVQIITDLRNI